MKTVYQFIEFNQESKEHTMHQANWVCRNKKGGEELGIVEWYKLWKQWCYFPTCPAVYSKGCLDDISHFVSQLTDEVVK